MDPRKFRIIKDSWNKTDRQDACNLAKALWVHVVTGESGIPTVYKPTGVVTGRSTTGSLRPGGLTVPAADAIVLKAEHGER